MFLLLLLQAIIWQVLSWGGTDPFKGVGLVALLLEVVSPRTEANGIWLRQSTKVSEERNAAGNTAVILVKDYVALMIVPVQSVDH